MCKGCDRVKVHLSQPIKSRLHHYEHRLSLASGNTSRLTEAYFHFDLARFYAQVVESSLADVNITELTYPHCGKYITEDQMNQRKHLKLNGKLADKFMFGMFGKFVFDSNSKLNYQELTMQIRQLTFRNGKVVQNNKIADWEFEGDQMGQLYFTSALEQNQRSDVDHYNIITAIVC